MAELDILTLDAGVLAALGVNEGHEQSIQRLVSAVSARIDELCGPVVKREVVEYHDGGCAAIWPRQTPVASVTSLREWNGSSTPTTLTEDTWGTAGAAAGFLLEQSGSYAHDARIYRRSGGGNAYFTSGRRSVELTYVAGRFDSTEDVDARFAQAGWSIVRAIWDREASAWSRGSADPFDATFASGSGFFNAVERRVDELLADERKPPGLA